MYNFVKSFVLILLLVGICPLKVSAFTEKQTQVQLEYEENNEWIIVEPLYVESKITKGEYKLLPYLKRRKKWGTMVGLAYSMFEPTSYVPNHSNDDFSTFYKSASAPLTELQIIIKRHFGSSSLGLDIGIGSYSASSNSGANLQIIPIRFGGRFALEGLFKEEPIVVPYVSGGAYIAKYSESLSGSNVDGSTGVSFYYNFGVMMQLNWINKNVARVGYEENGVENSFLYIEGRQFLSSSEAKDPDFASELHANLGVSIEF